MKICYKEIKPYPGYEKHAAMMLETDYAETINPQELQKAIRPYTLPEGMTVEDHLIPGTQVGTSLRLRIFTPAGLPEKAPMILDIHGGGFVKGNLDIDNGRCVALANLTEAIAVSVEYRLADENIKAPESMLDAWTAYCWLMEHAEELGGDPARIGVHGTSAGGNLAAALALYLRDRGEPAPALTVLNCPALDSVRTTSTNQYGSLSASRNAYPNIGLVVYAHLNDGEVPSYYALPGRCSDLRGLGPHMVITAEYDPLRDEGLLYALRLLETGIPCEILSAPRVTHGFCALQHPLSEWVHRGIAASFRREFGLEVKQI